MKNLIFCADGTWNGPGKDDAPPATFHSTNVFRLFVNLAGTDDPHDLMLRNEQERRLIDGDTLVQHAKYLHGVGDSENKLVHLLGGTFGAGIIARIVRGYTFISRNYVAGDRIFITGFSRGAYTARALAGLIAARGLLDATQLNLDDRVMAYRLGAAVWHDYRRAVGVGRRWLAALEEAALDLPAFLSAPPTDKRIADVPIEAVAVWETVGSLGIPDYVGMGTREDMFRFADVLLSAKVRRGLHALAVDERRADFAPTYWASDPRIIQCLFAGAHSDVGGGYPLANGESGLSDCAFAWMEARLTEMAVRFADSSPIPINPDPCGPAHQPWLDFPFSTRGQGPRELPDGLTLSQSVRDRVEAAAVMAGPDVVPRRYRPVNLGKYL